MAIGKWKKIKTEEIYQCGGFYSIDKDSVVTPGKKKTTYHVIRHPKHAVMIIPVDTDGKFYLTRQHRYPINEFTIEFPSGSVDNKESVLHAAKRELAEEMKLTSKKWKKLGEIYYIAGLSDLKATIFLANEVQPTEFTSQDPIDKNLHKTITMTERELVKKFGTQINTSFSITAYQLFKSKK